MYNKVIECLEESAYYFYEYDKVFFEKKGFSIDNVIGIEGHVDANYFLEFDDEGNIVVWNIDGKVVDIIEKKEHYKMIFELGMAIERIM